MSIEPVSSADKGKLSGHLAALAREDPTFSYKVNEETGQTLISGMGELHLEILKNRMIRDFNLKVHVGRPRVSYRETIKQAVKRVQGVCIRQTGGSGPVRQGHHRPGARGQPKGAPVLRFVNALKGRRHPRRVPPGDRGGPARGGQVGGRTGSPGRPEGHGDRRRLAPVDSNELAFRFAAGDALRKAVQEAGSVLLKPIMKLEVVTPEDYLGNVRADLSSRRALIDRRTPAAS
jgi:elongation factor G